MAIYHFSVKNISRSDGRSAVACAAYRSAEKLTCDYYGKEQDYTRKIGVEHTQIYAPENTNINLLNRQKLWNSVEKVERRKDATLAREFEIAFPNELNAEQRKSMLDDLCKKLVEKHGVVVDACIHAPHQNSGSDERNYHAHIMFTTRSIDLETGEFSAKKFRDFNKEVGSKTVKNWRSYFADLTNLHLEKAGFDIRVDHRSNKERGLDLEATQHEGPKVTQLRRMNIDTEISLKNDAIKQRNLLSSMPDVDHEIIATSKLLQQLKFEQSKLQTQSRESAFDDILNTASSKLTEINESFDKITENVNEKGSQKNIFDTLDSSISSLSKNELFSSLSDSINNQAEHERQVEHERQAEHERQVERERQAEREQQVKQKQTRNNYTPDF